MAIKFEHVKAPTPVACALIEALDQELCEEYPAEQQHGYSVDRIFQNDFVFFVAILNNVAVGCGGIHFSCKATELKRMYVTPSHRRLGVGTELLSRIEQEAFSRRTNEIYLETGDTSKPAIRLYESVGFKHIGPFGLYLNAKPFAIARSVFMKKSLIYCP